MSANNELHNHQSNEKKPVAFTVPLILASVFILIMVLFLSLCNPKHQHLAECDCKDKNCSKECMEACEKGNHSMHPTEAKQEQATSTETSEKIDSAVVANHSIK
jgi:hypothetical protein